MINRKVVQKALKQIGELDSNSGFNPVYSGDSQSGIISQMIYDIFGGEILKIHKRKGWHFYNRINGEPVDFTISEMDNYFSDNRLKGLPATPEETRYYFAQEDYSTFYMRFINAFEEITGLKRYRRRAIV